MRRLCKLRFIDFLFCVLTAAVLTGIVHITVFMHNKLCRNNFKSPYDFLSHRLHNRTADWAGTFIFTQLMRRDGHFDIFRKLVQNKCTLLLSRLGFRDCRCLLLNLFKMSVDFRLVEKHGHLTNDFFGCSFVLGTEVVLV